MRVHRIYGLFLRYSYLLYRNFDRAADTFYWPTIDLFLWGLTGLYVEKYTQDLNILVALISGLVFWYLVFRAQGEISVNLLEEFWSHNLVNIFVAPVKFSEWIMSVLINGLTKALASFAFASILAFILYRVAIFDLGFYVIPFMFLLLLTGWTFGFFIAGIIFRYGSKIQFFGWTLIYLISPFSAIYYPVSVLPDWAQNVAAFIPTSYVFEGLREVIHQGRFDVNKFLISLFLNVIYLIISIIYIHSSFKKALRKGLINVY